MPIVRIAKERSILILLLARRGYAVQEARRVKFLAHTKEVAGAASFGDEKIHLVARSKYEWMCSKEVGLPRFELGTSTMSM